MRIRSAASKLQCLATASELRDVAKSTCQVAEFRHCEYKMAEFRLDAEHRFLVVLYLQLYGRSPPSLIICLLPHLNWAKTP